MAFWASLISRCKLFSGHKAASKLAWIMKDDLVQSSQRTRRGHWLPAGSLLAAALWINSEWVHAEESRLNSSIDTAAVVNSKTQPSGSVANKENVLEQVEEKPNPHTAKWRVFTDLGRKSFYKGSSKEAENYFFQALEEAKKGFGEEDPHVASAYNNLAELFRMKKEYDKAEPLYLLAVERLKKSMGEEHESVGFALHNLAGFYLLQKKLEMARECYERSLEIKRRMLGANHPEYANTMFHLGEVFRLQGNLKDAEALIRNSLQILEEIGMGHSNTVVKRMNHLVEILVQSKQWEEAETLQRKAVHIAELSEESDSMTLVLALEALARILQELQKLPDCEALLQRCIDMKKKIFKPNHMMVGIASFRLGTVALQHGDKLASTDKVEALAEYEKAEILVSEAVRIAEENWKDMYSAKLTVHLMRAKSEREFDVAPGLTHVFLALVRSLNTLGLLGIRKLELAKNFEVSERKDSEMALRRALLLLKDQQINQLLGSSLDVKREYLHCVQYLAELLDRKGPPNCKHEEMLSLLREASAIEAELQMNKTQTPDYKV